MHLPAKPLMRFKTVCKSWYNLISSTEFAERHLEESLSLPNPRLRWVFSSRYLWSSKFDTFDDLTQLMNDRIVAVVGSCHGLLCLWISGLNSMSSQSHFALFNPTTRTRKTLTLLPKPVKLRGTNHFGFGYDSVTRDYKVVLAFGGNVDGFEGQVLVYSLREHSWMKVSDDHDRFSAEGDAGVLVNERLHWVHETFSEAGPLCSIVCFSLNDHSFSEVLPPSHEAHMFTSRLSVLEGCLCLSACESYYLHIWIMKEYDVAESWTRLFRVWRPRDFSFCKPVAYLLNRRELYLLLQDERVASLDVQTMKMKDLNFGRYISSFFLCVENLMMLEDAGNGAPVIDSQHGSKRKRGEFGEGRDVYQLPVSEI